MTHDVCRTCKGTGRDPMSDTMNWLPCPTCRGKKPVRDYTQAEHDAALRDIPKLWAAP